MEEGKKKRSTLDASFVSGAIALVFLVIGYQAAVFLHRAAVLRIVAGRDHPDTVFVERIPEPAGGGEETPAERPARTYRKNARHAPAVRAVREKTAPRVVESFRFNPNTVSPEDLQRLGFSEKQALAIVRYREKGGRFRRPEDFAKSYVVSDSVYDRLAPYIDIPRLDINRADSTALLSLPGIGPWFAGKILAYRSSLGGFSSPEQLMEIYRFDREKYDALSDLITCSAPEPFALWTLGEDALARHPHISRQEAHGIVLYRRHHAPENCTLEALLAAGVLSADHAAKLSRCRIAPAR